MDRLMYSDDVVENKKEDEFTRSHPEADEEACDIISRGKLLDREGKDVPPIRLGMPVEKQICEKMDLLHNTVRVEWVDSSRTSNDWRYKSIVVFCICNCESFGLVVFEDIDIISIAGNIADPEEKEPQVFGAITIPKCSIKRIIQLYDSSEATRFCAKKYITASSFKERVDEI